MTFSQFAHYMLHWPQCLFLPIWAVQIAGTCFLAKDLWDRRKP